MTCNHCDVCEGNGYDVFSVDREPDTEIERCDACQRYANDDAAAVAFVRALEQGDPWALRCLRALVPALANDSYTIASNPEYPNTQDAYPWELRRDGEPVALVADFDEGERIMRAMHRQPVEIGNDR